MSAPSPHTHTHISVLQTLIRSRARVKTGGLAAHDPVAQVGLLARGQDQEVLREALDLVVRDLDQGRAAHPGRGRRQENGESSPTFICLCLLSLLAI